VSSVRVTRFQLDAIGGPGEQLTEADIEVAATITYERLDKQQRTRPQDINYSWSEDVCTLGELLQLPTATRRPVVTSAMLDRSEKQVRAEIRQELADRARRQTVGEEGADAEGEVSQLVARLVELTEARIATARTEEDCRKALESISDLQTLGAPEEVSRRLTDAVATQYETIKAWTRQAAEDRPASSVAQLRQVRAAESLQLLGVEEPVNLPTAPARWSPEERQRIEARARELAAENTPRGCSLVGVDVQIEERRGPTLEVARLPDVTIMAQYRRELGERGLPVISAEGWTVRSADLLGGVVRSREPVVPRRT
jgi:hypothetical protein